MIDGPAGRAIDWLAGRRRRALERLWRDPMAAQERALRRLVGAARDTEFGLEHGFQGIRTVEEYQAQVPVRDYADHQPWLARAAGREAAVVWPGHCEDWVKTSGTTSGDKLIPVTPEALAAHRRGGWDALLAATRLVGGQVLMGGPMLFLGGSTALKPMGAHGHVGDLSGLVASRLPWGFRRRYSPGPACAAISDWEERLEAIAARAETQDIRLLSGMPS